MWTQAFPFDPAIPASTERYALNRVSYDSNDGDGDKKRHKDVQRPLRPLCGTPSEYSEEKEGRRDFCECHCEDVVDLRDVLKLATDRDIGQ